MTEYHTYFTFLQTNLSAFLILQCQPNVCVDNVTAPLQKQNLAKTRNYCIQLFTSVFAVAEDGSVISVFGLCPHIAVWPPLIPLLCW